MMARDIRVAFKLAEDKKELLQQYAESYGVTMSGLCAIIIGQWLHNQEHVAKPIIESVAEVVREAVRKELNEDNVRELVKSELAKAARK
jgi:replication initiation and membrane attachment protein DnaB